MIWSIRGGNHMHSRIPKLMADHKMSVYELSKITGLSRTTITPLANSEDVSPKTRIETLQKIAQAFNTSVLRLIYDDLKIQLVSDLELDDGDKSTVNPILFKLKYESETKIGHFIILGHTTPASFSGIPSNKGAENYPDIFASLMVGTMQSRLFLSLSLTSSAELLNTYVPTYEKAKDFIQSDDLLNSDDDFVSTFTTNEIENTIHTIVTGYEMQHKTTFSQVIWDTQVRAIPIIDDNNKERIIFSNTANEGKPIYHDLN